MTTTESVRRTPARTALVAGLVTAAAGVIVLILVGVPGFPLGLLAAAFLSVGAVLAGATAAMLSAPSAVGPFVGSVIQVVGLAVALVAGVPATVRAR